MICPVEVANEMSGPDGARMGMRMHSQRREANAGALPGSGPETGHEDQGSDQPSDEWTDQLDPGGGDPGHVGPAASAVEAAVGGVTCLEIFGPAKT